MPINIDLKKAQELLDAGFSKRKVSIEFGIHHSYICRAVERGELYDDYFPYDDVEDKAHLYQNFEWLWEEDNLEDVWRKAVDEGFVNLSEEFNREDFVRLGRYVRESYGNIITYLKDVDASPVEPYLHFKCAACNKVKGIEGFCKSRTDLFGIRVRECAKCITARVKAYRDTNEEYAEKCREACRAYAKSEAGKLSTKATYLNRRAMKKNLPDNLTAVQIETMLEFFEGCALTGKQKNLHLDHVIPLSIGHGGTTAENIVALIDFLNLSKHDGNLFEWFKENKQRFDLSQDKFDTLIDYLAELNEMTHAEYRDYVYWCHENPRTVDQIKKEAQ
jgi:hypothetical protein